MTEIGTALSTGIAEMALLSLDVGVLGALYRVVIGFAALPAMTAVLGRGTSDWMLVPFLLAILLLQRLGPAVLRRLLPVSSAAKDIWAQRRRTAKRYDSYQWRKLVWVGVGLMLYIAVSGQVSSIRTGIGLACLLAGAAGMVRWYAVCSSDKSAELPAHGTNRVV